MQRNRSHCFLKSLNILQAILLNIQMVKTFQSFSFSHFPGLLFSTEFAQPALVLTELASFKDMRAHGLISQDCIFAGHSLGEYAALAGMVFKRKLPDFNNPFRLAVGQVLTLSDLVDIVFLRGITMQNAVHRDANGRSQFAMVAVNPVRVVMIFGAVFFVLILL